MYALGQKRISVELVRMSALCHKQTLDDERLMSVFGLKAPHLKKLICVSRHILLAR